MPGQRYTAKIVVSGYDDTELILTVLPEAPSMPEKVSITPVATGTGIEADAGSVKPPSKPRRTQEKAKKKRQSAVKNTRGRQ
jgi:hypothetical protein